MPMFSKWYCLFNFSHQKLLCISHFSHACYMSLPPHLSLFDRPNNIWWSCPLYRLLQYPATASISGITNTLLSDILRLWTSFRVTNQIVITNFMNIFQFRVLWNDSVKRCVTLRSLCSSNSKLVFYTTINYL
jgi:hypothetical protein